MLIGHDKTKYSNPTSGGTTPLYGTNPAGTTPSTNEITTTPSGISLWFNHNITLLDN